LKIWKWKNSLACQSYFTI